jgi:hypothetical protein
MKSCIHENAAGEPAIVVSGEHRKLTSRRLTSDVTLSGRYSIQNTSFNIENGLLGALTSVSKPFSVTIPVNQVKAFNISRY